MKKIISVLLVISLLFVLGSCANVKNTPVDVNNFRVTTYLIAGEDNDLSDMDTDALAAVTDVILFGCAKFDENGKISLVSNMDKIVENAKKHCEGKRLYLNILGPDTQGEFDDWYDQMADKAQRHTNAFESGNLTNEILTVLNKYDFGGVFFDYEFPIKNKFWKSFNKYLVKLDTALGDKKLGMALTDWDCKLSKKAKQSVDLYELMTYDLWDENGNHATYDMMIESANKFIKKGFDKSKVDIGLPFYARPTDKSEYWYDYKGYAELIDENGLYFDKDLGKTFSFNTYDSIHSKTDYVIENGFGGVMIWHYSCDLNFENPKSLFKAIDTSVKEHK